MQQLRKQNEYKSKPVFRISDGWLDWLLLHFTSFHFFHFFHRQSHPAWKLKNTIAPSLLFLVSRIFQTTSWFYSPAPEPKTVHLPPRPLLGDDATFSDSDQQALPHPLIILRQVCRAFRPIANDLPFWSNDYFRFSSQLLSSRVLPRCLVPRFVEALVADIHLSGRLTKKTTWKFESHEAFRIAFERMGASLKFFWTWPTDKPCHACVTDYTQFNVLLDPLALCGGLMSLQLREVPNIHFDDIAEYWPLFEVLSVTYRRYSLARGVEDFGSLQGLLTLRKLSLLNLGGTKWWGKEIIERKVVLPLESPVSLLTELEIMDTEARLIEGHEKDTEFLAPSFHSFIHLKSLSIGPLTPDIADRITRADFRLLEFSIRVDFNFYYGDLTRLLAAQALRGLKTLGVSSSYCREANNAMISTIVTNLRASLQHVNFRVAHINRIIC